MRLWLRSARRYHARHPLQVLLAVLGVAVGVAVVLAMDLANASAQRAFAWTTESLVGRATHRVEGALGQGVPDAMVRWLRVDMGLHTVAPRVTGSVRLPREAERPPRNVTLLGVDVLSEADVRPWLAFEAGEGGPIPDLAALMTRPGAVLSTETARQELGLELGAPFALDVHGVRHEAVLVGALGSTGSAVDGMGTVLVADVATAQELLGRVGTLDGIDLRLDPVDVARIEAELQEGLRLEPVGAERGALRDLTRAFRTNLEALSLLALMVGAFLIFNTVQFSVVRRRRILGTVRALGARRSQVFAAILVEAAILGGLGTALGLLLGPWLARALVGLVAQTINDLYFTLSVTDVALPGLAFAKAMLLGVSVCVVAALAPAVEATSVAPREAMLRSSLDHSLGRVLRRTRLWALGFAAAGAILLLLPSTGLGWAYAGVFAVLLAAAFLVPSGCAVLLRLLGPGLRAVAGVSGSLAARGAATALSRTGVAVAALMLAVAASVGLGAMIASFRDTVSQWLATTLRADVYVTTPVAVAGRNEALIRDDVLEGLRSADGVASSYTYRRFRAEARRAAEALGEVQMVALQTGPELLETFELLEGAAARLGQALRQPGAVMVSEPLAYRLDLQVGDGFEVRADDGFVPLEVVAVYRDFSSEHGVAMVDRDATHARHWVDRGVSSLALFGAQGTDPEVLAARLDEIAAERGQALSIRSNLGLREASLEVFDRTFAITGALRLLCMAVAFLGIFCAMMALSLDRLREVGILRALGALPRQITALVLAQTGLLGLCAGLLALPVGALLAWLLVTVINRRSFGWTLLEVHVPEAVAVEALALAVGAALAAAAYPTWRFARTPMGVALKEEE